MKYNEISEWEDLKAFYLYKLSNPDKDYSEFLLYKIKDLAMGSPTAPELIRAYALKDAKAPKAG